MTSYLLLGLCGFVCGLSLSISQALPQATDAPTAGFCCIFCCSELLLQLAVGILQLMQFLLCLLQSCLSL